MTHHGFGLENGLLNVIEGGLPRGVWVCVAVFTGLSPDQESTSSSFPPLLTPSPMYADPPCFQLLSLCVLSPSFPSSLLLPPTVFFVISPLYFLSPSIYFFPLPPPLSPLPLPPPPSLPPHLLFFVLLLSLFLLSHHSLCCSRSLSLLFPLFFHTSLGKRRIFPNLFSEHSLK